VENHSQNGVSFSLKSKLNLVFSTLILAAIGAVTVSTVVLFREDKRAYTYDTQSIQTVLASKEFLGIGKRTADTLRVAFGLVNPHRPITDNQRSRVEDVLSNQTDIFKISFLKVDLVKKRSMVRSEIIDEIKLKDLGITNQMLKITSVQIRSAMASLAESGFAFINISEPGVVPALAVLIGDKNSQIGSILPVAVGYVSMRDLSKDLTGMKTTVATYSGQVLYDADPELMYIKKVIQNNSLFEHAISTKASSGAMDYKLSQDEMLGSFVRPGLGVVVMASAKWTDIMRSTYDLIEKTILIGLMVIAITIILNIIFSKSLTAPLNQLYQVTKEVASGNFEIRMKRTSRDEIGALSQSFNVMSEKISELVQESMEKVKLEGELEIASVVQKTLIPPDYYEDEQIQIKSAYQPADQCGGDWWGFFPAQGKMVVMIADATGHGFPSALITAAARSCFSVLQKMAQENPSFDMSPGEMLNYANRSIHEAALGQIMMTFFVGVLDFESGTMKFANAGHNPPWLLRRTENGLKQQSLMARGVRLGEEYEPPEFVEKTIQFEKGDLLFLYTDGLLEGTDLDGNMFGKKRVRAVIDKAIEQGDLELVEALMQEFSFYNTGKTFDDDITMASILIK